MLYQVLRSIPGEAYQPGDIVTGEGWRTLPQLVKQRYLAPKYEAAPAEIMARVNVPTPPAAATRATNNKQATPRGRGRGR